MIQKLAENFTGLLLKGFFSEILIFTLVLYYGLTENKKVNLLVSKKYSASVVIEGIYKLSFYSFC